MGTIKPELLLAGIIPMKGKFILFCVVLVLGASGFSSGAETDKVFNPMFPCNIKYHSNLMKLPLDLFKKR